MEHLPMTEHNCLSMITYPLHHPHLNWWNSWLKLVNQSTCPYNFLLAWDNGQALLFPSWEYYMAAKYGCYYHIEAKTKWPPFADDIFKCIFLNENVLISIKISLKFVPKGRINNISALVRILSEPMVVSFRMHICVTQPQWVNSVGPCDVI